MRVPGIFLAESIYRMVSVANAASLIAAVREVPKGESVVWAPAHNDSLIERSRSQLATQFLEDPSLADLDIFVTVDDDVAFSVDDLWKVATAAREQRALVAAAYPTRERKPHLALRLFEGQTPTFVPGPSRLVEVMYLATGLMAVPREVLEAMVVPGTRFADADGWHELHRCTRGSQGEPFYPFYGTFTVNEGTAERPAYHFLSEDYSISERARQLGYRCLCDTSIVLDHEGPISLHVGDIPYINAHPKPTGDPLVDELPQAIAEYLGAEPEMVPGMMAGARALYVRLWHEKPAAMTEREWYGLPAVGQAYILELARWHTEGGGCPPQYLEGLAGKRFLDFGAGIGTPALRAARAGAEAVTYDVNTTLREFIRYRARRHGLQVTSVVDTLEDAALTPASFDRICCWHVAEHVPDPGALLRTLRSLLKPEGLLIFDWDPADSGLDPMHHKLAEFPWANTEEMMAAAGFALHEAPFVYRLARE